MATECPSVAQALITSPAAFQQACITPSITPTVKLKDELANTAIQITCIDRNGKEVKRVTSSDSGDVEDNENTQPSTGGNTGGNGNNTGGNQGGNTGGGSGNHEPIGD